MCTGVPRVSDQINSVFSTLMYEVYYFQSKRQRMTYVQIIIYYCL